MEAVNITRVYQADTYSDPKEIVMVVGVGAQSGTHLAEK
jgi:hypothetical protein